ncbi:MAG: serine hydrolase domain-containing protein [Phycisphaerales bacterium]
MKTTPSVLIATAAFLIAPAASLAMPPAAANAQEAIPDAREVPAAVPLEAIRAQHGLPALAARGIAWDAETGQPITAFAEQVGLRAAGSESPVEATDLWHIGSCTKALTATLLATYVAQGRLRWDDTLGEVLPELVDLMSPPVTARTVADLVRHQAGMPANASPRLFGQLRVMDTAKGRAEVVREALMTAGAVHETDEPVYSNTGYVVAGAIAERLGGKPWEALLVERVLTPLGIAKSQYGFGAPPAGGDVTLPEQPVGHARVGDRWMPVPPGLLADNPAAYGPAGTLHLSLDAWAKFCVLHVRGEDLGEGQRDALGLSREDYAELHRAQKGFAAGWMVAQRPWATGETEADSGTVLTHAGSNTMWFAVAWLAPEKDWVLLGATNAAAEAGPKGADAAVGAALEALTARPQ